MIKISSLPAAGALTGTELVPVVKSGVTDQTTTQAIADLASGVAVQTHAATSKVTPTDNDELPLADSAASYGLKKLLWSNVKATLKTYFDALYMALVAPGTSGNVLTSNGSAWTSAAPTAQKVVQVVEATPYVTYSSTSTAIPRDDTIPQNTEGTEIITVSVTPANAANRLRVECVCSTLTADAARDVTAALFKDSAADALAASIITTGGANQQMQLVLNYEAAAGGTSAITFKIRIGPNAGTAYINGNSSARIFGGIASVRLRVTEFA